MSRGNLKKIKTILKRLKNAEIDRREK